MKYSDVIPSRGANNFSMKSNYVTASRVTRIFAMKSNYVISSSSDKDLCYEVQHTDNFERGMYLLQVKHLNDCLKLHENNVYQRVTKIILTIIISEMNGVQISEHKRYFKFLQLTHSIRDFLVYTLWSYPARLQPPCCADMTISFSTRSHLCISLDFTLEFYLLTALCLAENSQTWEASHSFSIRSTAYFRHISFSFSVK